MAPLRLKGDPMALTIIIKGPAPKGRTRTSIDRRLVENGWGSSFKNEADRDRCEYIERRLKRELDADTSIVPAELINRIK